MTALPSMAPALSHVINGNSIVRALPTSNSKLLFSPCRTMLVTMSSKKSRWTSVNDEIDAHLKQAIPTRSPLSVSEPLSHFTFGAPLTTVPALCIAACELVGGLRDQAMAAASAFRLMHAASFTHEQLPLTGRPRSSSSHAFGPNIQLLTGDAMVPFGVEMLALSDDPAQNNSDRLLRVIVEITRAIGSRGMINAQFNGLQQRQSDDQETIRRDWIDNVCKKKGGEIHACAGACGAILGGGNEEEVEKLRRYGQYVGMIEGAIHWGEGQRRPPMKEVNELRDLALKELEGFNHEKVQEISSLLPNY